jgi:hypothetical protein
VLSQGGAELLKYTDNRRFSSEPDVVESNRDADSRGFWSEPGAVEYNNIVSHYMTSFLVLHHERVRYRNGLLKPR